MTRHAALAAAGVLASLIVLAAEQVPPQATFRAGVDIMQLDVTVLDRNRRPVRGLTMADFTVLEDGKPRPVAAFTEVDLPPRVAATSASWTRDVSPDVVSNQLPEEGRLVVIMLDRSIPVGSATITAKRIASAAVNQLGPSDLGAVVSTSAGIPQNLTSDRTRLLKAINGSEVSAMESAEATEIAAGLAAGVGLPQSLTPLTDGRCYCGLCVIDAIANVANAVRDVPHRRKSLLFIGAELTLQSSDIDCSFRLKAAREKMMTALDRAGVTVHSIDPSGLQTLAAGASSRTGFNPAVLTQNLARQGTLQVLPGRTGGRSVANTNEPERDVPAIFQESGSYYLLGFRPTAAADGKFHKIEVNVNRRGLKVSTTRGYLAATAAPPPAAPAASPGTALPASVRDALGGVLPNAAVPLSLAVAAFADGVSSRATVALVVGVGAAPTPTERLEVVANAFDRQGRPKASARQVVELERSSAVDVLSRLDLAPGEYEIRVAVTGAHPTQTASVYTYATVPAFASEPISLSHIVLGHVPVVSSVPREFLAPVLPVVPTADRTFARTDRAIGFLRVYQGTARSAAIAPVLVRARIINANDFAVVDESGAIPESRFTSGRAADFPFDLPLDKLTPGEYLLNIEARVANRVATRNLRFTVK